MRDPGRIAAAIEILDAFDARRIPLKTALADWARDNRYAGAKDRAWISGLCLDVLRRRATLSAWGGAETNRARVVAALVGLWGNDLAVLDAAAEDEHGIDPLTDEERQCLEAIDTTSRQFDAPDWLSGPLERTFGGATGEELAGLSDRAPVDLRLNVLAAPAEKSLGALKSVKAEAHPYWKTAARIAAPDPRVRAPAVSVIPAFNKGWVEVQDLGSQIAAAAAGSIAGAQVLDYCAGGGGKTLALGALMGRSGQLYAYDIDARRLKPVYARAKRAGLRNLQIRSPVDGPGVLDDLEGRMDVVFVDAPCTGSGTWRRHPDAKWRLRPQQLERRCEEQADALASAARFVKPGGRLVYVTCSVLAEENQDQADQFLSDRDDFEAVSSLDAIEETDLLTSEGRSALAARMSRGGALSLTPAGVGADGFFIAALRRRS